MSGVLSHMPSSFFIDSLLSCSASCLAQLKQICCPSVLPYPPNEKTLWPLKQIPKRLFLGSFISSLQISHEYIRLIIFNPSLTANYYRTTTSTGSRKTLPVISGVMFRPNYRHFPMIRLLCVNKLLAGCDTPRPLTVDVIRHIINTTWTYVFTNSITTFMKKINNGNLTPRNLAHVYYSFLLSPSTPHLPQLAGQMSFSVIFSISMLLL